MKTYNTLFFGTPDFAIDPLAALLTLPAIKIKAVITQPDKPVGKKQTIQPPPIKKFALKKGLPVLQPEKIKPRQFMDQIIEHQPDVIIIVAYGKIIPEELLDIPPFGWLNVHASLLPKYRGASPIQSSILAGDKKTGVTLMQIDKGLDTGPIISQMETNIGYTDNYKDLHDKLKSLGGQIIRRDLEKYLAGKLKPHAQNNTDQPPTKTISKDDGKINWHNPADFIDRQIRAYNPWPGTFCFWQDKRIKIIEGEINMLPSNIEPGRVFIHGDKYYIGAKSNAIRIKKIQLAGKKPMEIREFITGHPEFTKAKLN